ncbi:invasion protein CiaB [Campylobacter sp. faydin G-105]|uniref:invasion protein CiaB n=1 Tax=Campylobacter anatolicus TaxID=2829105 RepID=UPI001BA01689|nr:invasion protein CiaB [Campylobacter anatolicus]MBR8461775.1 invasion protein CiaB [Campylobacter anatolicus]
MNDFKRLNELVREQKAQLNKLYKNLNDELIIKALKICGLNGNKSERIAVLRRIVDLKVDPLENELKKLGIDENEQKRILNLMFEFVRELYEKRHTELINQVKNEKILDDFNLAIIEAMHSVGLALNAWQTVWQERIIDTTNKEFEAKFDDITKAVEFISKNTLFQTDANGVRADRTYGAVVKSSENGVKKFSFAPYAVAFADEVKVVINAFENALLNLKNLAKTDEHNKFIIYFERLKNAFAERENDKVIVAWQDAEIAWMDVRGALQPGHPLEYYEDIYTHAVALEWDIRLVDDGGVDESEFKARVKRSYTQICADINLNDIALNRQVNANIERTQLYISVPMIYYAAELNGLFSAQVVPNDESVSVACGKKIFAFVNHVYESAKAKPFMRLGSEIFSYEFLNFNREILFLKPDVWKKIYEISTIGHEFGHILFIANDTEATMNKSGVFKFIEEYKATTGGLVNFFLHEDERYKMGVFAELIARSVGLVGWRKVDEVRAYYCEGLIHLSLLFKTGVLKFDGKSLNVDMSEMAYEKFKTACLVNYRDLATHYSKKVDASEFLHKFCVKDGVSYLPKDSKTREFVEYFYSRYEAIGNELDESGEWERWQKLASKLG